MAVITTIVPETESDTESQDKNKMDTISAVLQETIPMKTLEEEMEEYATKNHISVDQLDEDDMGYLEFSHNQNLIVRQKIATSIVTYDIPEKKIPDYLFAIYEIAVATEHGKDEVDIQSLEKWLHTIRTEQEAQFYKQLAIEWQNRYKKYSRSIEKPEKDLDKVLVALSNCNLSTEYNPRDLGVCRELFDATVELYDFSYEKTSHGEKTAVDERYLYWALKAGTQMNSAKQIRLVTNIYEETVDRGDLELSIHFANAVGSYAINHLLSEQRVKGLVNNLLPAFQQEDPQIRPLIKGTIASKQYEFGVEDFICHAYSAPVNPREIYELLLVTRHIPGSSYKRHEQSRLDAISLEDPFGILKDFIHDQRPGSQKILIEMVRYYESGDPTPLLRLLPNDEYYGEEREESRARLLDISNYEILVEDVLTGENVPAIDIVRRLVKNTKPIQERYPDTSNAELNEQLDKAYKETTAGGIVSQNTLLNLTRCINKQITEMMVTETIGVEPNYILAISWVQREAYKFVQQLSYEDQQTAYRYPWFESLLRFHEITTSLYFDENGFSEYIHNIQNAGSPQEAYRLIQKHTLEITNKLRDTFRNFPGFDPNELGSGDLTHELAGLIDPKQAKTTYGKKHRREVVNQMWNPTYSPGE